MALSIREMVEKGRRKLTAKAPTMSANYDAAKPKMKAGYDALPFGPNTKTAYSRAIDAAEYRVPDIDKWARNFESGVSR